MLFYLSEKLAPSDKSSRQFSLYNITLVNTEIPLKKRRRTQSELENASPRTKQTPKQQQKSGTEQIIEDKFREQKQQSSLFSVSLVDKYIA